MGALRKPAETDLNRPVLFRAPPPSAFRAQNGWAFLTAHLRKPGGRWGVVAFALCPTDVEWGKWRRKYHAPPAIFPTIR